MIHAPKEYMPCSCPGAPKIEPLELGENVADTHLSMRRCPCYEPRRVRLNAKQEIKCTQNVIPCNTTETEIENENIKDNGSMELADKQPMRTLHSMKRCPCFVPQKESVEENSNEEENNKHDINKVEEPADTKGQDKKDDSYESLYYRESVAIETNKLPVIQETEGEFTDEEITEDDLSAHTCCWCEANSDRLSTSDKTELSSLTQSSDLDVDNVEELQNVPEMEVEINSNEACTCMSASSVSSSNTNVPEMEVEINSNEVCTCISASSVSSSNTEVISSESCHCLDAASETEVPPTSVDYETFAEEREHDTCTWIKNGWRSKINLPTIAEFTENKCTELLHEILKIAKFNKRFAYSVDIVDRRRDDALDIYKYAATFSIPTISCPVPEVTASVYFVIVADRAKSPDRPLEVFYFYEYASSLVNILSIPPSDIPILAIMRSKRFIYRKQPRFYA